MELEFKVELETKLEEELVTEDELKGQGGTCGIVTEHEDDEESELDRDETKLEIVDDKFDELKALEELTDDETRAELELKTELEATTDELTPTNNELELIFLDETLELDVTTEDAVPDEAFDDDTTEDETNAGVELGVDEEDELIFELEAVVVAEITDEDLTEEELVAEDEAGLEFELTDELELKIPQVIAGLTTKFGTHEDDEDSELDKDEVILEAVDEEAGAELELKTELEAMTEDATDELVTAPELTDVTPADVPDEMVEDETGIELELTDEDELKGQGGTCGI